MRNTQENFQHQRAKNVSFNRQITIEANKSYYIEFTFSSLPILWLFLIKARVSCTLAMGIARASDFIHSLFRLFFLASIFFLSAGALVGISFFWGMPVVAVTVTPPTPVSEAGAAAAAGWS